MRHEGTGGSDRWCPRAFPPVRGRAARVGGSGTLVERIRASRRGGAVSRLTLGAAGAASPELAWERYVQVAYWSRWSPQIRSVTCSSPRIRTGSTGRVHAMLGVGVDFVVGSVDETARTWVWTVSKGPLTLAPDPSRRTGGGRVRDDAGDGRPAAGAAGLRAAGAAGSRAAGATSALTPPAAARAGCRGRGGCSTTLWASPGTFPGWSAGRARLTLNQDKRRRFDSYPGSRSDRASQRASSSSRVF